MGEQDAGCIHLLPALQVSGMPEGVTDEQPYFCCEFLWGALQAWWGPQPEHHLLTHQLVHSKWPCGYGATECLTSSSTVDFMYEHAWNNEMKHGNTHQSTHTFTELDKLNGDLTLQDFLYLGSFSLSFSHLV